MIIINGKKMDLGEMDSDFDFDLEDMFDGKEMIIDLDFDDKTKKMLINGEEIDMEDMEKWKEKAEKMKKEWKEKSKLMMLKSNAMKDKMRKMEKKMKIKMEKDFAFQGKDEDGKLQTYSFRIDSDNDDENVFFLNGKGHNDFPMKKEFNFRDDPEIDRLIVIDGKTSDFMTLKKLEKEEKIESVDILKSSTAKSIYGAKAKDGAIIVITKNN
ncbi:MAG: hypothetical protein HRT68_00930 [Flavobacteriaceae bacterium]|nr:hypothetical protein [Flavobacteriaceae bacterium]